MAGGLSSGRGSTTGGQRWCDGRLGCVEHERGDGAVQGEVQACAAVVGSNRCVERRRAGVVSGGGVPVGAVVAVRCWSARGGGRRGGRGARDDAASPAAQWFWRRRRRWSMPDGGEEERDEVEMDGVRCLLSLRGDVGEVWPHRVCGEELDDARAGRWRERDCRVPADDILDGEPARGCCLRACRAAGEACRDGLDGLLGREVVSVDACRTSRRPRFGVGPAFAVVRSVQQ